MLKSYKNKQFALTTLAGFLLCANAFAGTPNLRIDGTIDAYVPLKNTSMAAGDSTTGKHIVMEKIVLSTSAANWLASHNTALTKLTAADNLLPPQKQLGMNNVPVLDQGQHGTCVTFATSGALDAAHGSSDYVSQLCNLELGAFLEKQDPQYPSGWDGSWAHIVLQQMTDYGVISIASQHAIGCAGVYEYPTYDAYNTGKIMPPLKFKNRSDKIMSTIAVHTFLNPEDAFSSRVDMTNILSEVKTALNSGNRLVIGTLLDVGVGHNGAVGTYKVNNDTWMLTPQISQDAANHSIRAGHEMIITGYDDNAVVMGPNHTKQVGVLTLRNSWGSDAGDHGNYYMTYDHFKVLAMEVNEITPDAKH